jgi:hypothetical protein
MGDHACSSSRESELMAHRCRLPSCGQRQPGGKRVMPTSSAHTPAALALPGGQGHFLDHIEQALFVQTAEPG